MTLSFGPGPRSVRLSQLMQAAEMDMSRQPCCSGVAGGNACTTECMCEGDMARHDDVAALLRQVTEGEKG